MSGNVQGLEQVKIANYRFVVRPDSSDQKCINEILLKNDYWRRDFQPGDGPWHDLGANIGIFAVRVAKAGCPVVAYEPDPDSFQILCENIKLNGVADRVEARNFGLSTKSDDQAEFFLNTRQRNYWRNGLIKPWQGGEKITVKIQDHRAYDFSDSSVKMDIEGSEMPILETMVRWPRRLVFEWSFDVDDSIPRFMAIIRRAQAVYETVHYRRFAEGHERWQKSWFPPALKVWCYGKREN